MNFGALCNFFRPLTAISPGEMSNACSVISCMKISVVLQAFLTQGDWSEVLNPYLPTSALSLCYFPCKDFTVLDEAEHRSPGGILRLLPPPWDNHLGHGGTRWQEMGKGGPLEFYYVLFFFDERS
ncbi:hypothetical protein RRG08_062357 [Elysia crispata]|uniref:Uncharacterized protein n=1 Tax=Elysia crispata TaxID=231223 RepID=A0AAE1CYA3_9GAST|nr:hypothetical protein RRG08_062357 [Elysia crispata]